VGSEVGSIVGVDDGDLEGLFEEDVDDFNEGRTDGCMDGSS